MIIFDSLLTLNCSFIKMKHDVAPKRENDGPFSFTDEDWIPHSAAWLTALVRITE